LRPSKVDYYLEIAEAISKRGTCIRRTFGAVIVNRDQIISTGYVGAPRGMTNCIDIGRCIRQEQNIVPGERYELCRSVHAEMNAIIHASRADMIGGSLYLAGFDADGSYVRNAEPCKLCKRMIINSGISEVIIKKRSELVDLDHCFDIVRMEVDYWVKTEEFLLSDSY